MNCIKCGSFAINEGNYDRVRGVDSDLCDVHYWMERATRITELQAQLNTERMRVVACGVVALQNTEKSKAERITKDNPYWTASYGDVCRAVDAEIDLRAQLAEQKELIMQMVKAVKQDRIEWEDFPPSSLLAFSKLITSIQAEGKA